MNVIIPMTGYGSRFVAAGYTDLKPMICVCGRPIIEWIIKGMYSKEDIFFLVCRQEHFDDKKLDEKYLLSLAPNVRILKIKNWVKLGPVYDIMQVQKLIPDHEPCIVNYCDFFSPWQWKTVKKSLLDNGCDGAVLAFTGFQPCLVPEKNVYASCLADEKGNLIEIREKHCFEKDKFKGMHSTGTYYFRTAAIMKECFTRCIEEKVMLKGEYYASLPYNFLVEAGYRVWVPVPTELFYTWGTPEDLEEFVFWVNAVKGWSV